MKNNIVMEKINLCVFLGAVMALTACSNTYASRHECEEQLARDRGTIVGAVAGSQVGNGTGQAVGSVVGGVAGGVAGGALYTPDAINDNVPYTRSRFFGIFSGCKPVAEVSE